MTGTLIDIPLLSSLSNMDFKRNRSEEKFCNIIINILKRHFPKAKIYLKESQTQFSAKSIIIEKSRKFFFSTKEFFEIQVSDSWGMLSTTLIERRVGGFSYTNKNSQCNNYFNFSFYGYDEINKGNSTRINDLFLNFYKIREIIDSVSQFLKN